jgi:hypothetical protein
VRAAAAALAAVVALSIGVAFLGRTPAAAKGEPVEDTDLEAAILGMPPPVDGLVPCDAMGPSGRIEIDALVRQGGFSLSERDRAAIAESGIIMYRRTWCGDDGLVVEVHGVSTNGREDFGGALLELVSGSGGDEFTAPVAGSTATSRAIVGGVLHQVSFARNGRFFAAAAVLDDDAGRDIAIAAATRLEPRAAALDSRHDPEPLWQSALPVVALLAVILGIVLGVGAIMRHNRARDRRRRGGPGDGSPSSPTAPAPATPIGGASRSSDPLGFG